MKPDGAQSVMAATAGREQAKDDPRTRLLRALEYFPTQLWAGRAGGELLNRLDPGRWWWWDPGCGEGHLAAALAPYAERVYATDIHDYAADAAAGLGSCLAAGSLQAGPPLDFLADAADLVDGADWIVANPPFTKAAEFVAAGLRRARRGVMILGRSQLYESEGRQALFFGGPGVSHGPAGCKASFFDRVPVHLGRCETGGSGATALSWFVWFQPAAEPLWITDFRDQTRRLGVHALPDIAIPFGTKARLSRPDDARLWGALSAAPLFDEGASE